MSNLSRDEVSLLDAWIKVLKQQQMARKLTVHEPKGDAAHHPLSSKVHLLRGL